MGLLLYRRRSLSKGCGSVKDTAGVERRSTRKRNHDGNSSANKWFSTHPDNSDIYFLCGRASCGDRQANSNRQTYSEWQAYRKQPACSEWCESSRGRKARGKWEARSGRSRGEERRKSHCNHRWRGCRCCCLPHRRPNRPLLLRSEAQSQGPRSQIRIR